MARLNLLLACCFLTVGGLHAAQANQLPAALDWPCQRAAVSRAAIDMPPYMFLNEQKQLVGYRVEFMQQLFARLKCDLKIMTDLPWKRSLILLENGEVDVLMNVSKSAEREHYAWFSAAYDDEKVALFVAAAQREHIQLKQIADLATADIRVGIIRGNHYGAQFMALLAQAEKRGNVVEAIDKPALYQLVLRDRVQVYLDYYPNGLLGLRDEKLDQEIVRYPLAPLSIGQVHFMFSKKSVSPAFVRQLDLALAAMQQDGSVRKLQYKYGITPG